MAERNFGWICKFFFFEGPIQLSSFQKLELRWFCLSKTMYMKKKWVTAETTQKSGTVCFNFAQILPS